MTLGGLTLIIETLELTAIMIFKSHYNSLLMSALSLLIYPMTFTSYLLLPTECSATMNHENGDTS